MWLVMHKIGLLVSDHGAAMLVFDPVLDSLWVWVEDNDEKEQQLNSFIKTHSTNGQCFWKEKHLLTSPVVCNDSRKIEEGRWYGYEQKDLLTFANDFFLSLNHSSPAKKSSLHLWASGTFYTSNLGSCQTTAETKQKNHAAQITLWVFLKVLLMPQYLAYQFCTQSDCSPNYQ